MLEYKMISKLDQNEKDKNIVQDGCKGREHR